MTAAAAARPALPRVMVESENDRLAMVPRAGGPVTGADACAI